MANAYIPPGVTVSENFSPTVSPLLASPADICIVALAGNTSLGQSDLTTTDNVILSGTGTHLLPTIASLNSNAQLISVNWVRNLTNPLPSAYTETTDYVVDLGMGPPTGTHATIKRAANGSAIPDGALVSVNYSYAPVDYWNPIRLFDIGAVEARFGNSWAITSSAITGVNYATGINSQLSMAARIAFENGAQSVICQPLFTLNNSKDPVAPTGVETEPATWQTTLAGLQSIEDIDIIVPVQDSSMTTDDTLSIFTSVQSHLAFMNTQQQYIIAIFGEDGTVTGTGSNTTGLMNTMRTVHAPGLQSNYGNTLSHQCVLINNTVFLRGAPGGAGTTITMGGQYAAAAVAGQLGGRPVSSSLTRKSILGFQAVTDPRIPADKNADAGAGMFVIEQVKGQIRCRQALTLDIANGPEFSELSVVRSKHLMMESIQQTLDNQIIGNIIADANSPIIVRSAIAGVLSLLQAGGTIVGYTAPVAALTSLNPTTITASFSYQAAFPVNYVKVTFSLDMTSGIVTVT